MLGLRWLCHLSLHCLPSLPSTNLAIKDHLWGPYFQTSFLTRLSSWSVQGFFLRNFDLLLSDSGKESQLSSSGISSQYVFLTIQTICNLKITANIYIITQYYFSQTILPLTPIHSFAATQPLSPSLPYNIIYSKMLKFSSDNKNAVNTHSSPHHHDSIEKVLFRLKDLQQIQDESRNELCPVFLDEQSNPNLRRESTYSNRGGAHQINILKDLQLFQEEQKLQAKEAKASHKRLPYNEKKDDNVLLSNMKLKEDNIKLFSQCIRLRKICELYKTNLEEFHKQPKVEQKNQREAALERQLSQLMIQHQDLNRTNKILEDKVLKLEDKIKKLTSQISSTSLKAGRFEKISSQVHLLQRQNDTLAKKVIYLEKELQLSSSRCDSKSISIHNTTQQSRKGDLQKDRMITNMKIVHESEVRKLKGMIEQLQRELGREVGGGSSRR